MGSRLPADVVRQIEACKKNVTEMRTARRVIEGRVRELVEESLSGDGDDDDGDAIPGETFDDPSVVREVTQLRREAERVRRSSSSPPPAIAARARR